VFLRRALRALILALVTTLFVVVVMQGLILGMGIATWGESDLGIGDSSLWLRTPHRWGPLWLAVALGYPAVVATLWHTDLRKSVPVVALVLLVSAGLAGLAGLLGRIACVAIALLPFIGLGALIWCARRWGKEPAPLPTPPEEDAGARARA
jgi:hypothetical protein